MPTHLRHHQFLLCAILAALSVAIGYAFIWIPNVEFITAAIFMSGFMTGRFQGAWIGLLASFLFFYLLNPIGASPLPLLSAQMFSMGLVGYLGGALNKTSWLYYGGWKTIFLFSAIGLIVTVCYDVMTNLIYAVMTAQWDRQKIVSIFVASNLFSLVHIISNVIGFSLLVPKILLRLQKLALN